MKLFAVLLAVFLTMVTATAAAVDYNRIIDLVESRSELLRQSSQRKHDKLVDHSKDYRQLYQEALAGDVHAQFELGRCLQDFCKGEWYERDMAMSAYWLAMAASNGHAEANYLLGRNIENGSIELYTITITRDTPPNWQETAHGYKEMNDKNLAMELYVEADRLGYPDAAAAIDSLNERIERGRLFERGREAASKEMAEMIKRAIDSGAAEDFFNVANLYRNGFEYREGGALPAVISFPNHNAGAAAWYAKAADLGHVRATSELAQLYEMGYGVEQDLEIATQLYIMAANMGDEFSRDRLRAFERNRQREEAQSALWAGLANQISKLLSAQPASPVENDGPNVWQQMDAQRQRDLGEFAWQMPP